MNGLVENIIEFGEEFIKPFKEFIHDNHGNPILWVALLGLGIATFAYTYGTLHKQH